MRTFIIDRLNELLEKDHDLIAELLITEKVLAIGSDMEGHPATFEKQGVEMSTALEIISHCLDCDPIQADHENGIIRRFF